MYSIYADNLCIYNDMSPLENLRIISPKLTLEDCSAGSLTMTIPQTNIGYSSIVRLVTDISVRKNDVEIWSGRVLTEDNDFLNNKILYCEGDLAFFNDTTQPQAEYHDITVRGFLETLVNIHNSKVAANRRFTVGAVTVTDPNDSLYRYTNYEKTIECINDKLINRLGGYMRVRKENGVRYLDYLADTPNTNTQVIQFGKNLMDFTRKWDMSEFATVILPLGCRLEESEIDALESYLTVESVNNGSKYVTSAEAVENYGWIEKVVHWDNVTTPTALLRKTQRYLSEIQFDEMVIELTALDMHYMDVDVEDVKLLDKIKVKSLPHGLNKYFPVTKLDIPLDSPDNTVFTLGSRIRSGLTSVNNQTNSEILQSIENLPKAHSILNQAKDNARAIMNLATNGYITITKDEYGSQSLYVSDARDYREATKYWLLNMNGFGYSGDGGETFGVAITMDGAIVADYITAGHLNGEIIQSGSIKTEAMSQEFKTTLMNNIDMAKAQVRQEFTAAYGQLESYIEETYATKSELEDTETTLSSSITQTANGIRTEVNRKVNASDFGSYMVQNYSSFLLGFNGQSRVIQINTSGIGIYEDGISEQNRMIRFNGNGMEIWRSGVNIGKIGTNTWAGYSDYRGLVFDLEYNGKYMTWARKTSSDASTYTTVLTYARVGAVFSSEGIYAGCNLYISGYEINSPNLTDVRAGGYSTFSGQKTFVTDIHPQSDGSITVDYATYDINNGMFIN